MFLCIPLPLKSYPRVISTSQSVLSVTGNYVCFTFISGTRVIAATSNFVRVYNAVNGEFVAPLKGHKDAVYCVCYNRDGSRFASGK